MNASGRLWSGSSADMISHDIATTAFTSDQDTAFIHIRSMACPRPQPPPKAQPCSLFALTQFECSPEGGRLQCWPIERVFRK